MLCSPYMCRILFVVCLFVFALYVSLHVLVVCPCRLRRLCVSFVCGVCVWAFVFIVLVAARAPSSKVVSWLFALSILAQIPIGDFWAGVVFPRMGFCALGVHLAQILTYYSLLKGFTP